MPLFFYVFFNVITENGFNCRCDLLRNVSAHTDRITTDLRKNITQPTEIGKHYRGACRDAFQSGDPKCFTTAWQHKHICSCVELFQFFVRYLACKNAAIGDSLTGRQSHKFDAVPVILANEHEFG